ncbi:MAG: citrate/2-methylcitrate synthase, partial [Pirellulaceae bacterium]
MSDELYRPGLEGVIAGESSVSTVQAGLLYRGYAIEELAAQSTYEEVAYLILYGELPKAGELKAFQQRLASQAAVPSPVIEMLRHIPNSVPLMDVMRSGA